MLSTLIALSSLAVSLQAEPSPSQFWIKLACEERPAQDGQPPAFIIAGTTNLPHRSRIDVEFYYEKYSIGHSLATKVIRIQNGTFSRNLSRKLG